MLKMLKSVAVVGSTVIAGGVALFSAGYLIADISPAVKQAALGLSEGDLANLALIGGIACATALVAANIGKPFDRLMDRMYPNDILPKQVV